MLTTFNGNLSTPLDFGHCLFIVGKTIDGARRFELNLRTGKDDDADIGLHFAPKFATNEIIRNSKVLGTWGTEEKLDNIEPNVNSNPIKPGDFFLIYIFVGKTKFYISIDNCAYCTYKFRLPINDIENIEIKDYIQTVKQIDHRIIYPFAWPPIQGICAPSVFSHDCPILFVPGHVIVITARVFGSPKGQFILKFCDGDRRRELLHFNPRFEPHMVVVRNSMKTNMEFLEEERDGGFPFTFDEEFNLAICFTETEFQFAVNGERFVNFTYRVADLLKTLVGFKIACSGGMFIHVSGVDHLRMPNGNCEGFENASQQ